MGAFYGFITAIGALYGFITAMGTLYGFITAMGATYGFFIAIGAQTPAAALMSRDMLVVPISLRKSQNIFLISNNKNVIILGL